MTNIYGPTQKWKTSRFRSKMQEWQIMKKWISQIIIIQLFTFACALFDKQIYSGNYEGNLLIFWRKLTKTRYISEIQL